MFTEIGSVFFGLVGLSDVASRSGSVVSKTRFLPVFAGREMQRHINSTAISACGHVKLHNLLIFVKMNHRYCHRCLLPTACQPSIVIEACPARLAGSALTKSGLGACEDTSRREGPCWRPPRLATACVLCLGDSICELNTTTMIIARRRRCLT